MRTYTHLGIRAFGPSIVSARYWSFTDINPESGTELRMQEFSLQDETDTTLVGTYSQTAGGSIFSGSLTNLDNDNFSDGVWWGSGTVPISLKIDYGTEVTPKRVFVRSPQSGGQQQKTPSSWILSYSEDDAVYIPILTVSGESGWSPTETRTYIIQEL